MTTQSLVAVEQKEVSFYEDKVIAIRVKDGAIYVPIRPICELLGVDSSSQRRRIEKNEVLSEVAQPCDVVTASQGQKPQRRAMLCLPLEFVSGFLFGISTSRVKEEVRPRLLRYQRECYRVLSEAFFEGRLTQESSFEALLEQDTPAVQAYKTFAALTKLARNQVLIEGRLDNHEERLEQIEAALGNPNQSVTPDEAMQISQAVKSIAMAMGKKSGRNEYGGVYGEFYRRFGINSYKLLPRNQFEKAMAFLNEWQQSVSGVEPF